MPSIYSLCCALSVRFAAEGSPIHIFYIFWGLPLLAVLLPSFIDTVFLIPCLDPPPMTRDAYLRHQHATPLSPPLHNLPCCRSDRASIYVRRPTCDPGLVSNMITGPQGLIHWRHDHRLADSGFVRRTFSSTYYDLGYWDGLVGYMLG